MNRDDIIRMSQEAGFICLFPDEAVNGIGTIYDSGDEEITETVKRFAALVAAEKDKEIAVLQKALDAALDFAGTVGGSSSWWEEVWPEHEAAIDAARGEK